MAALVSYRRDGGGGVVEIDNPPVKPRRHGRCGRPGAGLLCRRATSSGREGGSAHQQPFGILHGGVTMVLAEALGSCGAHYASAEGRRAVGLDINANLVPPGPCTSAARPRSGRLTWPTSKGGQRAFRALPWRCHARIGKGAPWARAAVQDAMRYQVRRSVPPAASVQRDGQMSDNLNRAVFR